MCHYAPMPRARELRSNLAMTRRIAAQLTVLLCAAISLPDAARAFSEGPQLAYIDPGAGSFILQAVLAAFAGVVVATGAYWSRIKRFLGIGTSGADSDDETGDRSEDS